MNKFFVYIIAGAIFILGVLLRIIFAAFFPEKFSNGARDVLFLVDREKALFRPESQDETEKDNGHEEWDDWIPWRNCS